MKKTLTVNLNGTVFHIDEDAYQLLDKYLDNLRLHFRKEEGSEEILNDFESRIAELFDERIRLGYQVITIDQVEMIIERMGKPEEIFEAEAEETTASDGPETGRSTTTETTFTERTATKRRFFRDPDDKILGGVASGFAAYMGWDPTAVRVILLLLLFFTNIIIVPIYLVLWLIVPQARTASEKLEMRGESVTVENIGRTVTNGFGAAASHISSQTNPAPSRSGIQRVGDVVVQVIGVILKLLGILTAVILSPVLLLVLFILIVVAFAVIFGGVGALYSLIPSVNWSLMGMYPEWTLVLGSIGAVLAIGIPVGTILYMIFGQLFRWKPIPQGVKWTFLILWIISLICCLVFGAHLPAPWSYRYWDHLSI